MDSLIFNPGEGYEYVMTLSLLAVMIGTLRPGQWSVDGHISALQGLWGWPGLGIAAGGGTIGTLILLAVFWRPGAASRFQRNRARSRGSFCSVVDRLRGAFALSSFLEPPAPSGSD